MANPFDLAYLTTATSAFGPLAWLFFLLQVLGVAAGLYLLYIHQERDALRRELLRQLAIALLIIGGIGSLLGVLRLLNVPLLNQRFWFYIQLLVELGLAGYIFYYIRTVYPKMAAATTSRGRTSSARPPTPPRVGTSARSPQNGINDPTPPRPVSTTGRREARRDRKRKNR